MRNVFQLHHESGGGKALRARWEFANLVFSYEIDTAEVPNFAKKVFSYQINTIIEASFTN